MPPFNILVLPGDGVGAEVTTEAIKVLRVIESYTTTKFNITQDHVGESSFERHGVSITRQVLDLAKQSDAVLFGSEAGPPLDKSIMARDSGLLQLRKELDVFANLRPCRFPSQSLYHLSVLKEESVTGTDFLTIRENCGGSYFGPKVETDDYGEDKWSYSRFEVQRVVRVAAAVARLHNPPWPVISCDKANVLASGRLWRRVVSETFAKEFPDIKLTHQLADSAAMIMMKNPRSFNGVLLTENTFGDMLSDESSVIPGSLGLLPSASLSGIPGEAGVKGMYEPIHGTAPDIAGKNVVNPIGQILSLALLLRYSCHMNKEADAVEKAVGIALDSLDLGGLEVRTRDLGGTSSTSEMGDAVCQALKEVLEFRSSGVNGTRAGKE